MQIHNSHPLGGDAEAWVIKLRVVQVLYNDKSPMENHHLAAAFALINKPEYDVLAGVSKEARAAMRKLIIELVLSTE